MVTKRDSVGATKEYPSNDSKFPARAARGVEPMLPPFKPIGGYLGPYELVCELGSGGMGTVYVARRTYEGGVTRTVALKTLRKDLAFQPDLVEMFMDEARITSRISHPYVCTVMDIGSADGVPYVTMDYLIGEPLSRLAPLMASEQTEASVASILRVIANLCEGLHAAHEQRDEAGTSMQVVHRDISPDNLFVLYDGSVRVADFGIACTAEHQRSGKASALAGKSGYMSPEQIRGQMVDRRADVWSMGVVLWELLTGKRLFRPGTEIAATVAVLERPIDSPSKFNKLVPSGLDAVVRKALHRDRDHRYPTARAMALELENVLTRCFGPVSAARLSGWLDDLFPGCQEFRRTIVPRSQAWLKTQKQLENLEFDPASEFLTPHVVLPQTGMSRELDLLSLARSQALQAGQSFAAFSVQSGELMLPEETSIIPVIMGEPPPLTGAIPKPSPVANDNAPTGLAQLIAASPLPVECPVAPPEPAVMPVRRLSRLSMTIQSEHVLRNGLIAFVGGIAVVGGIALFSSGAAPAPSSMAIADAHKSDAPKPAQVLPAAPPTELRPEPASKAALAQPSAAAAVASALVSPEAKTALAPAATPPPAVSAPAVETPPLVAQQTSVEVSVPPTAKETPAVEQAAKPKPKPVQAVKSAAPVAEQAEPNAMGEVYVFAKATDFVILIKGKEIPAPVLLRLPVTTLTLTVRRGDSGPTKVMRINPTPGTQSIVKLD